MTKRGAQYAIDPNTLQQSLQNDVEVPATKEAIAQRKIFKIVRNPQPQNEVSNAKLKFRMKQDIKMDCLPIETQADKINCPKAEKYTNIFITNEPIFSTSQSESFNIFSNINLKQPINIFAFSANNTTEVFKSNNMDNNIKDNQEGEQDSAQLQKQQKMQIDPSKSSVKYQYEIQCDKLVSMRLVKYKYNDGDLIENVDIALLHVPKKDLSVVKVQLPETGNCIFEGFLLRGKSHINKINKLSCKLVVFTFTKDKRIDKHLLKMQFKDQTQADLFCGRVQTHLMASEADQLC